MATPSRREVDDLVAKGAVLALERDGKALGIGGLGPTQIVFPRAERPDLADMSDDLWNSWQIYHIKVESLGAENQTGRARTSK